MIDMRKTIVPKSDQINFDDLIGGQARTIKITGVKVTSGDQPVALSFEGDEGKSYKPGKSMRRVLVHCWGSNANAYIGRSMTIYGDPDVLFAGQKVGGIRISHLSDITAPVTMALTATRAARKPYTVQPLNSQSPPADHSTFDTLLQEAYGATTIEGIETIAKKASKAAKGIPQAKVDEMREVINSKRAELKGDSQS